MMFKFLREFFHLSHKELRGAVALLFLLFLIFVVPKVYYKYQKPETSNDNVAFKNWIAEIDAQDSINNSSNLYAENEENTIEKFPFDFNTVAYNEMIQLGIDGKTANILIKFRNKGAKFYNKDDVMKIYGFTDELYSSLEDYIHFPKNNYFEKDNFSSDKKSKIAKQKKPIDPNTATWKEMVSLGIESKTANILLKYRKNGAKFHTKEDLLKVFGFTEELYTELEDYILFPEKIDTAFFKQEEINDEIPTLYLVDINSADSADFIKLKGIGKFYAKTIIEYRNKLGGFYNVNQLKEAYGITEELFSSLEMNFTIESPVFRKIDLNNTNFTELIRHPYLDKKMTVEILNLEKQIGGFLSINDLRSYSVLDEKTFEVMKHYLEVKPSK